MSWLEFEPNSSNFLVSREFKRNGRVVSLYACGEEPCFYSKRTGWGCYLDITQYRAVGEVAYRKGDNFLIKFFPKAFS